MAMQAEDGIVGVGEAVVGGGGGSQLHLLMAPLAIVDGALGEAGTVRAPPH